MKLDNKKIGYLRQAPSATSRRRPASGPDKAMFNKLVKTGHIDLTEEGYRRTRKGDEAIEAFDEALQPHAIAILHTILSGQKIALWERGFLSLVDARLIRIGAQGNVHLTDDGRAIAERTWTTGGA